MVSDLDIWRAANLLVRKHGANAALEAAKRADVMLDRGDDEGRLLWSRIRRAIEDLRALRADRVHLGSRRNEGDSCRDRRVAHNVDFWNRWTAGPRAGNAGHFSASARQVGYFDRPLRPPAAICRCPRRPKGQSWPRNDPEFGR
jgi:hypothetical protein